MKIRGKPNLFEFVFSSSQLNVSEFSILASLSLCLFHRTILYDFFIRLSFRLSACLSVCLLVSWSCFLSALIRPFWEVTTLSLLDGLCGFEFRSMEKSGEKRKRSDNRNLPSSISQDLLSTFYLFNWKTESRKDEFQVALARDKCN